MNTAQIKLLVGGLLITGALSSLGYLAATNSPTFAIDVKQYKEAPEEWAPRGLRMAGISAKGTWKSERNIHTFELADETNLASTIPVKFEGTMPDTFREESLVFVEGRMRDGTLVASLVIPQCASKYEGIPSGYEKKDGKTIPVFSRPPASGSEASLDKQ